jgi:hypothetical protein
LLVVLQYRSIDKSFNNKFGEFIIDFVYDVTLTVISRALIKKYLFFQKKTPTISKKVPKRGKKARKKKHVNIIKLIKHPSLLNIITYFLKRNSHYTTMYETHLKENLYVKQ